jgi:uncharacterized phage-like protein YoqJ
MDGNHKEKVEAINSLQNQIDAIMQSFDAIMVYLKAKTKDWKESNLMVNKEIFAFLSFCNGLEPKPFTKKAFPPLCKFLIEKMSDAKFKDDIQTYNPFHI